MLFRSGIPQLSIRKGIDTTWNSWYDIWHSGNLTNLNQLTNGPGYITGESDTLATVTGRGASTSTRSTFNGGVTIPDATVNYLGNIQTTDYSTFTIMSRAWSSVQGTNGLAYTFNTHSNAGGGGYGALQIYYGEGGKVQAPTSFRAPVFYDSDDTSYYLNANSTSVLNGVNYWGVQWWAGDGVYARGTNSYGYRFNNYADTINAFVINNSGDTTSYSSSRAPIFYDSNDTSYWVDPNAGTSANLAGITKTNNARLVLRDDSIENWATASDSAGVAINYYGYGSGTSYYRDFNVYDGKGSLRFKTYGSGNYAYAPASFRAPIFYDSDDTSYYLDPASYSRLNRLVVHQARVD